MRNWSLMQWIVAVIIIAGCIAILYIVLPQLGVSIPGWVISIFWVCLVVVVAIAAIRFLMSLWGGPGPGPGP